MKTIQTISLLNSRFKICNNNNQTLFFKRYCIKDVLFLSYSSQINNGQPKGTGITRPIPGTIRGQHNALHGSLLGKFYLIP